MAKYKCNIGKLLETKGIKQKELAAAIGATEVSVSRWISGFRVPKATDCILIARVLDCAVEDLYSIEERKQTNADRIRTMCDEEIVEFFFEKFIEWNNVCDKIKNADVIFTRKERFLQWLKSEVAKEEV